VDRSRQTRTFRETDDAAFNTESVAADQLKQFIERLERLEEEKAGTQGDIKDVMAELKGRILTRKLSELS
jgi:uncharacterized protein (UPF0335 family)